MKIILAILLAAFCVCGRLAAENPAPTIDWNGNILEQLLPIRQLSLSGAKTSSRGFPLAADSLSGMASLSCSGVVVRIGSNPDAQAVLLSNGHCYDMLEPNSFVADQPYERNVMLFGANNQRRRYQADRILYATLTGTDISLMRLNATYRELANLGIDSYEIDPQPAKPGDAIIVASGYFARTQRCSIGKIVYKLRESRWEWNDSYKLQGCVAEHGMSGSPLVSVATHKIVGVLNTGSDDGERCTFNNPCEVDSSGNVVVEQGSAYAQHVDAITGCVNAQGRFDVRAPSCGLFRQSQLKGRMNPKGWM